jgi:dihydroxyacid dehydratase/phosphogluconate dehydratase
MDARTDIEIRLPSRHMTEGPARAQAGLSGQAEIFKKTPDVADLKPRGRHVAADMRQVADIPLLMNTLLDNGHLDGDCITVPGRPIAEDLKSAKPIAAACGVVGWQGNGATVKAADMSNFRLAGPARGFDAEAGTLNVKLTGAGLAGRRTKRTVRETHHRSGALWKFAQGVGPALGGAVIHPGGAHEKQCYADS